ncbi:MAG: phosphatase PAP2 family protein [Rikenellaceae bacterium]
MTKIIITVAELNRQAFDVLNNDLGPFWDSFFWNFSGKLIWAPLYILILYLIYRKVGLRNMLAAMTIMVLMTVVCDHIGNFFKENYSQLRPSHDPNVGSIVHRVRNYYGGGLYGTVSSHSSISFSIAIFSLLTIKRWYYTWPILMWALLIAYSRIYLGAHYPKDVIFGIALGSVSGYGFYRSYLVAANRWKWLNNPNKKNKEIKE